MADIETRETVWIPMPDGTRLAARLWLPSGAENAPVPCVLEYIPYRRRDFTRARDDETHPHFARAGYASIRVDIRGYGDSEGVAEDEYSHQETQDGVDVIVWIAGQPWCDGNVGMFGKSWGAYNALQVAAKRPPALKAILPVMGCDDRYREDIHFYGGCLANDNFWWGCIMQLFNAMPPDADVVGGRWREMWLERLEAMEFWPAKWLEHQTRDEMWQRGSVCENYADVAVPVYYMGGWSDLYCDTPFRLAQNLSGPVKVLVGPWGHLFPHEGAPLPRADFLGEATRWWDHWLKGRDTGILDEPRIRTWLQDSYAPSGIQPERRGRWVEEPNWPSPNVSHKTLWLNDGTLAAQANDGPELSISSPQTYGAAGADMMSFALDGDMPADGRIDAGGALLFRGESLTKPMDVLGNPSVSLKIAVDQPRGLLAAVLYDEAPNGAQTLVSRGFANLSHVAHGPTEPAPAPTDTEIAIDIELTAIGQRIAAGHRLVLHIATAYWPILWPAGPKPLKARLTAGSSALHLPLRSAAAQTSPRDITLEGPAQPKAGVTTLRAGDMSRTATLDQITGALTHRCIIDGGVFGPIGDIQIDATGTVMGTLSDRAYTIHPDDPLSASAEMRQDAHLTIAGHKLRIETRARQSATADTFHLTASTRAYEGEALVFERDWTRQIPRNGM